jgi:hypothetical protein
MNTAPVFTIVKDLGNSGSNWVVYHKDISPDYALKLNTNSAQSNSNNYWQSTAPTNSLLTFTGSTASNGSGNDMIAYCFAEKKGFSKFGRYDGNGNVDGNFVYTGFKPSWIMFRRYDSTGEWLIYDNKRDPHNLVDTRLEAQDNFADSTSSGKSLDFLSNGFKIRGGDGDINTNGGDYIYMAFGQSLVGSNNVPCTAR